MFEPNPFVLSKIPKAATIFVRSQKQAYGNKQNWQAIKEDSSLTRG